MALLRQSRRLPVLRRIAALRRLGSAYGSLAPAAQSQDKRQYAAAGMAITTADAALRAAFVQLRQDGYSIG